MKSLTNELAVLKRNNRSSPYRMPRALSSGGHGGRTGSGQRAPSRERQRSTSRDRNTVGTSRRRSFSNERRAFQPKLRTPSPAGGRVPRFDPTAYVERKKQRLQEVNSRLGYVYSIEYNIVITNIKEGPSQMSHFLCKAYLTILDRPHL